jgi:7,8-dihydroneopterin aldolase/epimerase/oxygenase
MATSRIRLGGIACQGRHGANPGEQLEAQDFLVDLEVLVDVGGDTLERTLDYRVIADTVRDAVAGQPRVLLESLAQAVARAVFEFEPVQEVMAVIHKPAAAQSMGVDDVSADALLR